MALLLQQGGTLDDMLEGEEQLSESLESLPSLCRFQYDKASAFICRLIDPLLDSYKAAAHLAQPPQAQQSQQQHMANGGGSSSGGALANGGGCAVGGAEASGGGPPPSAQQLQQLAVLEGQLTWLVYVVGSVIKGRLSATSSDAQVRAAGGGAGCWMAACCTVWGPLLWCSRTCGTAPALHSCTSTLCGVAP